MLLGENEKERKREIKKSPSKFEGFFIFSWELLYNIQTYNVFINSSKTIPKNEIPPKVMIALITISIDLIFKCLNFQVLL
tara:strand:- start:761 stop:1000 length:240 start_codon:yes stop_codon:yes gene_type:complete